MKSAKLLALRALAPYLPQALRDLVPHMPRVIHALINHYDMQPLNGMLLQYFLKKS